MIKYNILQVLLLTSFIFYIIYLLSCATFNLLLKYRRVCTNNTLEDPRWIDLNIREFTLVTPLGPMMGYCFIGFQSPNSSLSTMAIPRILSFLTTYSPSKNNSFSSLYMVKFLVFSSECLIINAKLFVFRSNILKLVF